MATGPNIPDQATPDDYITIADDYELSVSHFKIPAYYEGDVGGLIASKGLLRYVLRCSVDSFRRCVWLKRCA